MRNLVFVLLIPALGLLSGCGETTQPLGEESGSATFQVSLAPVRDLGLAVGRVTVYALHLAHGYADSTDLTVSPDTTDAQGTVEDLTHGDWAVLVALYDPQSVVIASGRDTVQVTPGYTTQASIVLDFESGDMDVNVTWGNMVHLSIDGLEVAVLPAYDLLPGTPVHLGGRRLESYCSCLYDSLRVTRNDTLVFSDQFVDLAYWTTFGNPAPNIEYECYENECLRMNGDVYDSGVCSLTPFNWGSGWELSVRVFVEGGLYLGDGTERAASLSADYWNSVRFGIAGLRPCGETTFPIIMVDFGDQRENLTFSTDGGANSVEVTAYPYYAGWHTFTISIE